MAVPEGAALGAAFLARMAAGLEPSLDGSRRWARPGTGSTPIRVAGGSSRPLRRFVTLGSVVAPLGSAVPVATQSLQRRTPRSDALLAAGPSPRSDALLAADPVPARSPGSSTDSCQLGGAGSKATLTAPLSPWVARARRASCQWSRGNRWVSMPVRSTRPAATMSR